MRYFLVFYNIHTHFKGNGHFDYKGETFPSLKDIKMHVIGRHHEGLGTIESITVSNIIELTKEDYENWIK